MNRLSGYSYALMWSLGNASATNLKHIIAKHTGKAARKVSLFLSKERASLNAPVFPLVTLCIPAHLSFWFPLKTPFTFYFLVFERFNLVALRLSFNAVTVCTSVNKKTEIKRDSSIFCRERNPSSSHPFSLKCALSVPRHPLPCVVLASRSVAVLFGGLTRLCCMLSSS